MGSAKQKSSRAAEKKTGMTSSEAGRGLFCVFDKEPARGGSAGEVWESFVFGREKVFGFTRGEDAVVLKLPAERVAELLEQRGAELLVMGKRAMKEWVVLERGERWGMEFFREALGFARTGC